MILGAVLLSVLLPPQAEEPSVESLVRLLHSDSLEARERASADLRKLGSRAAAALKEVASGSDAEAAARARGLLHLIRIDRLCRPVIAKIDNPFGPFGRADYFQIAPDGKTAVGCDLENVYVWSVPEGRLIRTWRGHSGHVAPAFNREGTRLLTMADRNREMNLWEYPSGRLLKRWVGDGRSPRQVVVAPGGERLAITNGSVEWVEAATGRVLWSWTSDSPGGDFTADVSRDGKTLVVGSYNTPRLSILNDKGGLIRKVELRSNSLGRESRVYLTDDGTGVVIDNFQTGGRLINIATGEQAKTPPADRYALRGKKARFVVVRSGTDKVEDGVARLELEKIDSLVAVTLTPDERYVLAQTLNGRSITRWDLANNNRRIQIGTEASCFEVGAEGVLVGTRSGEVMLHDFDGKELRRIRHGTSRITSVAFAGGSRIVAQGSDLAFRCFDWDKGERWRRDFTRFKQGPVRFHPDGRRAFAVFDGANHTAEFASWTLDTGAIVRSYGNVEGFIRGCAVSGDGSLVAISGRGGFFIVWEVESGKRLWGTRTGWMVNTIDFTQDRASLILGGEDGRIERRSSQTGDVEAVFEDQGPRVLYAALNAEDSYFAVSGDDGPVRVYDAKSGRKLVQVEDAGYPVDFLREATVVTPFATISAVTGGVQLHPPRVPPHVSCIDDTRTRLAMASIHTNRISVADVEGKGLVWGITSSFLPEVVYLGAGGTRALVWNSSDGGKSAGYAVGKSTEPEWEAKGWVSCDSARSLVFEHTTRGRQTYDLSTGAPRELLKGIIDGPLRFPPGSPCAFGIQKNVPWLLDPLTLQPIRELPEVRNIDFVDCDTAGSFLLEGWTLLDPRSGRVVGTIEPDLSGLSSESKVVRTFFGKDGEKILALTANGLVITLVPGD